MKHKIIYTLASRSSFVQNDLALLRNEYLVLENHFALNPKWRLPISYFKQLVFLLLNVGASKAIVVMFGGHHSFLPALFGKVFNKPCFIINGGTDCVAFPSIGYGNFKGGLLRSVTKQSYRMAACLVPVHESLAGYNYSYDNRDFKVQGIRSFMPDLKTPIKAVNFGFDPEYWKSEQSKKSNSFITVAAGLGNPYRAELKGVDLIIEAAKKFPEATFTIIGCPEHHSLGNLTENVKTFSFVSNEKLIEIFAQHEFYIQVSMSEGFPNAICEAMLCGCIPIGSEVGGIPDIIGETGFMLKRRDQKAFESLLNLAMKSDKPKLSNEARSRIIKRYPKEKRETELIRLFNVYINING